jgi:hypothetical protein
MTSTSLRRSVSGQLCSPCATCKDYATTKVGVSDPQELHMGDPCSPEEAELLWSQALPKVGGTLQGDTHLPTKLCEARREGWKPLA